MFPLRVTESDEALFDLVSVARSSPFRGVADAGVRVKRRRQVDLLV